MIAAFFLVFLGLILMELIKGLSANGTPPVLQKFDWQIDLAHFMWSNIFVLRIILVAFMAALTWQIVLTAGWGFYLGVVFFGAVWWGVYWVFNRFWVGKYKFLPISQKVFLGASENKVDTNIQVLGVDHDGVQKAYPVNMLFYHHQITDDIAGQPIWVTYCGLCRSGRVYDISTPEGPMEFGLVGAITYNAVFRDIATGSWWRQETGEAAKGPREGDQLPDVAFEQMSLANWLEKHPESTVLQYDPTFEKKYNFTAKLLSYEISLPGWHMQATPPLILGVEVEGAAKGYDFNQLLKRRLVNDDINGHPVLVIGDEASDSAFAYDRRVGEGVLTFEATDDGIKDTETGSTWTQYGRCVSGQNVGAQLQVIQSYKQFLRAWISFHPDTEFFDF